MAVNKVIYGGKTLVDLTGDSVTPETLVEGETAHNASGVRITGTMKSGGGSSVQTDWNQNDETAPDFLKNRPFYDEPIVVLEEQELVPESYEDGALAELTSATPEDSIIIVTFDGETYETKIVMLEGLKLFGNLGLVGLGEDTGEPFFAISFDAFVQFFPADGAAHTVKISINNVHKIPEKFLPSKPTFYVNAPTGYLYMDVLCTTPAYIDDIPDDLNFSVGFVFDNIVCMWTRPILSYSKLVSTLEFGYHIVLVTTEDPTIYNTYYTGEYTGEVG